MRLHSELDSIHQGGTEKSSLLKVLNLSGHPELHSELDSIHQGGTEKSSLLKVLNLSSHPEPPSEASLCYIPIEECCLRTR